MRLRSFLSSLFTLPLAACAIPVVGNSPEEVKHRKDISNVKIEDLEKPIERELTFDCAGYTVKARITKDFLIPCYNRKDLYYEYNSFGKYYKVIAEAIKHNKENISLSTRLRFEGNIFEIKDLDREWHCSISEITYALQYSGFVGQPITEIPNQIIKV